MGKLYDDSSIESLSPRDFTRLRPGVYCGSTEYSTQLLIEIVSNAIDEYSVGHGNVIRVSYEDNGTCQVEDFAQGFPVNVMREDGETVLQAAFDVLNTSGKFSDDGVYEGTALGLNGIGSKLTNFLSKWLIVTTFRDGKSETIHFEDGIFKSRETKITRSDRTGTIVKWQPDSQFFNNVQIDVEKVKSMFKTLVCLCPGLEIHLTHNDETIVFKSENGLNDLVSDVVKDDEIIKNRLNINYKNGKNKLDFVLTFTDRYSMNMISYVNTGETDSGPHITQIKTIVTRELNKFFREKKWLKEKDTNLTGDDINEGLVVAFNITAPGVSYDAQTKSRIVKIDMAPFSSIIAEAIQNWLSENEKEVKKIADKALNARKAREAAKKAREAVRTKGEKKNKLLNMPTKLVDSWSKNRVECELLIAEGDSAAAGLIGARDSKTQAVFPIRGKILSCLKSTDDKIFANQEIVNMIKAIGLEIDPKTRRLIYDKNDLRYGKIIMCADGDPDGDSIKNLLLTCFWVLCPELIIQGHVYSAIPPLFRVTTKKNEYIYLRDAGALNAYKEEHKGEKFLVNRNKGLGESDSEELDVCLLNPETRNIVQVTVEDVQKANEMFEILMGTKVEPRREYMLIHGEEANV